MMSDWVVWPIFVIQAITLVAMFISRSERLLKCSYHLWVGVLVFVCAIYIGASLIHDSTTILHLYF